ncbi:hypothetical protein JG687_00007575 [Phytophthora cactorum]|uniref:DDE-1 domain-containing protein n=1 Tax=Phytophthora cactorum TaxID=29920 RepID=A0A8T1UF43_9STRA|nr:hypothetical protein JG687_00007575 [Phytophthora cactorum]
MIATCRKKDMRLLDGRLTPPCVLPLPANSMVVCQPLDVGVMGRLKTTLRALWLTYFRNGYVTASEN